MNKHQNWEVNFLKLLILPMLFWVNSNFAQESIPSSSSSSFPAGSIKGPFSWKSDIYPGSLRDYWIYVPAQYDPQKPSCSIIVQDGLGRAKGWDLPQVLDSLIHQKAIPSMIGIFVDHGKVAAAGTESYPRYNRSFEYDALGERYARFLLEELLPEVKRTYNLSDDPNDRSIAGASSGGICAFNVAWERPDAFSRVLSTIGTYVGLRGGDELATLVRKTEPKPLRIFLEDGNNDLNIYAGDWWMANQDMLSALTWAGYEVEHIWGEEGHNSRGAKRNMPDILKWLWQNYPQPVSSHLEGYKGLELVYPNESWEVLSTEDIDIQRLAVDQKGQVFFTEKYSQAIYTLNENGLVKLAYDLGFNTGGISFHQDGRLYLSNLDQRQIVAIDENGNEEIVLTNLSADYLLVSKLGIYFTDTSQSRIGFYAFETKQLSYIENEEQPVGISLSVDQTFLQVTVAQGVQAYSYKLTKEGHLAYGQPYIHYHIPYGKPTSDTDGITHDASNRTYTATAMGVQVADQLGRINYIFSKPGREHTDLKFGGNNLDTLYLICDGQLYGRKIKAKGVLPWQDPVKPPKPRM